MIMIDATTEKEKLLKLMTTSQEIDHLYKSLLKIELLGMKESDEYNNYFELLKEHVKTENLLIIQEFKDEDKIMNFITALVDGDNRDELLDVDGFVAKLRYRDSYRRRLITKLKDRRHNLLAYTDYPSHYDDYGYVDSTKLGIILPIKLNEEFSKEYNYNFLNALDESIETEDFCREQLIKSKYFFSLFHSEIEDIMLKTKFGQNNGVILDDESLANFYEIDSETIANSKNHFAQNLAIEHMGNILEYPDEVADSIRGKAMLILRRNFIKASVSMLDQETAIDVNSSFHEFASSCNYGYECGKQLITDLFTNILVEGSKVKKISYPENYPYYYHMEQ